MAELDPATACTTLIGHLESDRVDAVHALVTAITGARLSLGAGGEEALRVAVETGRPELVAALLPLGIHHYATVTGSAARRACSVATHALTLGHARVALTLLAAGVPAETYQLDGEHWAALASELMSWAELRPRQLEPLLGLVSRHGAALLNAAIRARRKDLVDYLLEHGVGPDPPIGARVELPLANAVLGADLALIDALAARGADVNALDRDGWTVLARAIQYPYAHESQRAEVVRALLRHGAVPDIRNAAMLDAFALAEIHGLTAIAALLHKHRFDYGPRQSRDARAAGIRDICLVYDKADGFVYRIGEPGGRFFVGGDYDGAWPTDAWGAQDEFERINARRGDVIRWFAPFLDRLLRGREFAYAELACFADRFTTRSFADRPNWGR